MRVRFQPSTIKGIKIDIELQSSFRTNQGNRPALLGKNFSIADGQCRLVFNPAQYDVKTRLLSIRNKQHLTFVKMIGAIDATNPQFAPADGAPFVITQEGTKPVTAKQANGDIRCR